MLYIRLDEGICNYNINKDLIESKENWMEDSNNM